MTPTSAPNPSAGSKRRWILPIFIALFLALSSCLATKPSLQGAWKANPSFQIGYWGTDWKDVPLSKRLHPAPGELVEKIRIENEMEGFEERPEPSKPLAEMGYALEALEESLPPPVRRLLEERLVGVFCVRDLGGTGYADVVYDREGDETYGLIVLDGDVLRKRTANDWATWKESSYFRQAAGSGISVEARIEAPQNDSVENAVRFILLHELGHILGMVSRVHASWIDWQAGKPVSLDDPFVALSWRPGRNTVFESRFDDIFPQRKEIRAYGFERSNLPDSEIPDTYENLLRHSDFPSLPAAQSPWEDFAESFATYVHVVLDGRLRETRVTRNGQTILVVPSCWGTDRCAGKQAFMKGWMEDPASLGRPRPRAGSLRN